jgi:hypothetical protein
LDSSIIRTTNNNNNGKRRKKMNKDAKESMVLFNQELGVFVFILFMLFHNRIYDSSFQENSWNDEKTGFSDE